MKLIDLDQTIFVPIVDESKGGVTYEMQMTVKQFFQRFFSEVPPIIDAIPVEWLRGLMIEYANINTPEHAACAYCLNNVIKEWQKGQEAQD